MAELTENYFKKNESRLASFYPGLTLRRLKSEIETYAFYHNLENVFQGHYPLSSLHPISRFFEQLHHGVPLEYITRKAYFYKSEFYVDERVLIPRSETEVLVEMATREITQIAKLTDETIRVADVGIGSGAIALSILQESNLPLQVRGFDISVDALKVAKKNWFKLRYKIAPSSDLRLIQSDRLKESIEQFHLIVCNPPYIKKNEDRAFVHNQVDTFEPHVALYLPDEDYVSWFSELAAEVNESLLCEGIFLMEGHEDHWDEITPLFQALKLETQLIKDLTGAPRFMRAKKVLG